MARRPSAPSGRPLVLLVDADPTRARTCTEYLARADIDVCTVSRVAAAQTLVLRTELLFDAIVLHHRLSDGCGLDLLERLAPEQRPCSVLVIDAPVHSERSRRYWALGAHRYISPPEDPLCLIGQVSATINETRVWRGLDLPAQTQEPPRIFLDPEQAADRLQFICNLSTLERDVAFMLLMGERDMVIARRLGKSERTAKRHVGRVLEKAHIQNRSSLWSVLYHDGRKDGAVSSIEPGSSGGGGSAPSDGSPSEPISDNEPGMAAAGRPGATPVPPGRPAPPTAPPPHARW